MIIQDWEREKYMEDVYLMEKQFDEEYRYFNKFKRKPHKIRLKDRDKIKSKMFRIIKTNYECIR